MELKSQVTAATKSSGWVGANHCCCGKVKWEGEQAFSLPLVPGLGSALLSRLLGSGWMGGGFQEIVGQQVPVVVEVGLGSRLDSLDKHS